MWKPPWKKKKLGFQKLIDIIIKSPGAFDSFLLVYDLHAYIESLKKIKQRNEIMFLSWVLSLHHLKLQKTNGD